MNNMQNNYHNIISFTKVKLPWGWLGNMSAHPVELNGREYPTTEHLFQALRFDANHSIINEICKHKSPIRAKMMVKSYKNDFIIEPRSDEDIENMFGVLYLKIDTYPDLKYDLLNTGNAVIVEDVTGRPTESGLFWGAKQVGNNWIGTNTLGKCWMRIRESLW